MFVIHLLLATFASFELWQSVNGDRPPPYKHFIDECGKSSGDSGPTGLNWPECTIPYYIDRKSFDQVARQKIEQIMVEQYHSKTCIRFRPWQQNDRNWIEIAYKHSTCSAVVGMQSYGGQLVNLALHCMHDVTITHELMHTVGFNNQHTAYNRDDYIIIHWENVDAKAKFKFDKETPQDNQDGSYGFDFNSVMMYGRFTLSKNDQPVIDARPPFVFTQIFYGNDYGLDWKDVQKIRMRYQNVCRCYANSGSPVTNTTQPAHTNNSSRLDAIYNRLPVKVPKFPQTNFTFADRPPHSLN